MDGPELPEGCHPAEFIARKPFVFIGAHIMKRRGYVLSVVWGCVASGVRFPRFKLELQLHDLEKVICPFCASVFSFVNPEENDLPHRAVVKITYNMLSK